MKTGIIENDFNHEGQIYHHKTEVDYEFDLGDNREIRVADIQVLELYDDEQNSIEVDESMSDEVLFDIEENIDMLSEYGEGI